MLLRNVQSIQRSTILKSLHSHHRWVLNPGIGSLMCYRIEIFQINGSSGRLMQKKKRKTIKLETNFKNFKLNYRNTSNKNEGIFFEGKFATLDTMHALCLPLGASVSLLIMFFFFDSMQLLFAVCTASKLTFIILFFFKLLS